MAINAPPGQQRALAWSLLIAAVVWLVPANLLPIMSVTETGRGKASTIADGIWQLFEAGMPGIAIIVFVASLLVPFPSLIHISESTRLLSISYAVFCLKKKSEDSLAMTVLLIFCLLYPSTIPLASQQYLIPSSLL